MTQVQPNIGLIRRVLRAEDGPAFNDAPANAPISGEDYTPGFILTAGPTGVTVLSSRPSNDKNRSRDMSAYADALRAAGFNVQTVTRIRDDAEVVTSVKVIRW